MAKIAPALIYTLENEGGSKYTNDQRDPGGPTKYGITLSTLAGFRHKKCTAEDVKALSLEEATRIYKIKYWDILDLDNVDSQAIATCIFDCSVNRGPGIAKNYRDQICRTYGIKHVNDCSEIDFVPAFSKRAEQGYQAIVASKPRMKVFLKGWLRRAKRMLKLLKF